MNKRYQIFVLDNSVMAIDTMSEAHKVNAQYFGFKLNSEVEIEATDAEQAQQIFIRNNKPKRSLLSNVNKWLYGAFHVLMTVWWFNSTNEFSTPIGLNYNGIELINEIVNNPIISSMLLPIWAIFGSFGGLIVYLTRAKNWLSL